ncbi:hypothetical protein GCK32_010089 [Trichostrongylus colubriformis]|uniref:Uncharacterized protein n=1 Tax=Trichostrongylus colubriformis TaxID=6319 RepID=A0AAN8EYH7_TRICO
MVISAPLTTSTSDFDESLVVDEEDSENFVPYKYWNFYKRSTTQAKAQSESFMDRFLSIFHHEPSSTTPPMQDDPPLYAPFAKFGRRIMDQYYNNLRTKWNFLDRFQCSCTGNLVDIPRAKSFITMRVAYD